MTQSAEVRHSRMTEPRTLALCGNRNMQSCARLAQTPHLRKPRERRCSRRVARHMNYGAVPEPRQRNQLEQVEDADPSNALASTSRGSCRVQRAGRASVPNMIERNRRLPMAASLNDHGVASPLHTPVIVLASVPDILASLISVKSRRFRSNPNKTPCRCP